jgi:ABC-type sugar transport system ATPase subunit/ribose/xylose/arabinose/galactoside ABC-type transport system permease subunit
VSFDIRAGEVHALCGENGAGKTTFNHILSGAIVPDAGTVTIFGESFEFGDISRAQELGVSIVHQEPTTFPDLDAVDNIFLMHEITAGPLLDKAAMAKESKARLESIGETYDVNVPLQDLSFAQRQMAAIARAANNCKLLILDEPTASLSRKEADALFEAVRMLKSQGAAVLFVSHRLEEVFELADRITVLRDGHLVATHDADAISRDQLVGLMVGRKVETVLRVGVLSNDITLQVTNLTKQNAYANISFSVRAGEVVALSGLIGAGRSEIARTLAGIDSPDSGEVTVDGNVMPFGTHDARVAYVPEDRQQEGIFSQLSIRENLSLATLRNLSKGGWIDARAERALAESIRSRLGIKTKSLEAPASTLSGGNQQKVVLGKWVAANPRVLILDEPTHGIDVGAKAEVHALVGELASQGVAILLISSELPEVMTLADRIIVLRQGEIAAEVLRGEASEQQLLDAALPRESKQDYSTKQRHNPLAREIATAVLLALTVIAAGILNPRFFDLNNIRDMLINVAPAVIIGCGLTLIVIAREIDISVGSLMGLCAAVLGIAASTSRMGLAPTIAMLACLGVGALGGLVNGLLVSFGKIPSIIVTLATLSMFRGVTELALGGEWIQDIPPELRQFGTGAAFGVPYSVVAAIAIALATAVLATRTPFGRRVHALGSNPKAAELVGVPTRRIKLALFTLAGLLVAAATLFGATQLQVIESGFGQGFELVAVAAVVVGGTSIMGGRGTILGTVLACCLLGIVSTVLIFMRLGEMSTYWERAIQGGFVLAAVLADYLARRRVAVT